jgi:hypothetical protein
MESMSDINRDIRAAFAAFRHPIPYGEYRFARIPPDMSDFFRRSPEPDYSKPIPVRAVELWVERVVHNYGPEKGYAIFGQLDDVTIPVDGPPWVMAHERASGTSHHGP